MTNATPWHNWFSGNFGGLSVLTTGNGNGVGGFDDGVVLGGGAGTVIRVRRAGSPGVPDSARAQQPLVWIRSGRRARLAARRKIS